MVETLTYDALSSNKLWGAVVGIGDADWEFFVLPGSSIPAAVAENFFLRRFHFPRGNLCSIVKPVQM
jgi:hypothetical protein